MPAAVALNQPEDEFNVRFSITLRLNGVVGRSKFGFHILSRTHAEAWGEDYHGRKAAATPGQVKADPWVHFTGTFDAKTDLWEFVAKNGDKFFVNSTFTEFSYHDNFVKKDMEGSIIKRDERFESYDRQMHPEDYLGENEI